MARISDNLILQMTDNKIVLREESTDTEAIFEMDSLLRLLSEGIETDREAGHFMFGQIKVPVELLPIVCFHLGYFYAHSIQDQ